MGRATRSPQHEGYRSRRGGLRSDVHGIPSGAQGVSDTHQRHRICAALPSCRGFEEHDSLCKNLLALENAEGGDINLTDAAQRDECGNALPLCPHPHPLFRAFFLNFLLSTRATAASAAAVSLAW